LTESLLRGCMGNISSECATQGLILWKSLRAKLGMPTQPAYWCFIQVLSTLRNVKFLVSALAKPNDLLRVRLEELHWIWNNSNCLLEWQIHESRMISRTHFLMEFAVSYNCSETPGWAVQGASQIIFHWLFISIM
jgi:hypothetical protein